MIRAQDLTPDVYYNQSRDFQFIGRLFDLVLNSVKTNSEAIYNLPLSQNSDEHLLDLMALTLGFKLKHNYNSAQLKAICEVFAEVIRSKGSILAIVKALNTLFNAEGLRVFASYEISNNQLSIHTPPELKDTNLLRDLLNYILPVGITCNFRKITNYVKTVPPTKLSVSDYLAYSQLKDTKTSVIVGKVETTVEGAHPEDHEVLIGATSNSTVIGKYKTENEENS